MDALTALKSSRSIQHDSEALSSPITSVNMRFIQNVGRDLAQIAWKNSTLPTGLTLEELGASSIPSGLAPFERLLDPVIFNIFLGVSYFHPFASDATWKLYVKFREITPLSFFLFQTAWI